MKARCKTTLPDAKPAQYSGTNQDLPRSTSQSTTDSSILLINHQHQAHTVLLLRMQQLAQLRTLSNDLCRTSITSSTHIFGHKGQCKLRHKYRLHEARHAT